MVPFKVNQSTVECNFARLLATIAVGVVVGVLASYALPHAAAYFDFSLSPNLQTGLQIALGVIAAALTWPASRNVFDFTEDCMNVPTVSPAFQRSTTPARARAITPAPAPATNVAEMETSPQDDGSMKVSITFSGLTKREFNTMRKRLETVSGVTWAHPRNLRNGKRTMEGTLPAGPTRPEALRKIEELTGKRV